MVYTSLVGVFNIAYHLRKDRLFDVRPLFLKLTTYWTKNKILIGHAFDRNRKIKRQSADSSKEGFVGGSTFDYLHFDFSLREEPWRLRDYKVGCLVNKTEIATPETSSSPRRRVCSPSRVRLSPIITPRLAAHWFSLVPLFDYIQ